MAELTTNERMEKRGISPIVRSFMHVALLRRLGMAQSEDERQKFIAEFMAIRAEPEARQYVAKVKHEARLQDRLVRETKKRRPKWPGY